MLQEILEIYADTEILVADGFDEAVIGIDENSMRLIYSVAKCLDILEKDMEYQEATEYFVFNVQGAYVGEQTPIWCWDSFTA